jgi:hypothetical protein
MTISETAYPMVGMFEWPRVLLPPAPYHCDVTPSTVLGVTMAILSVSGVPSKAFIYNSCSILLAVDELLQRVN